MAQTPPLTPQIPQMPLMEPTQLLMEPTPALMEPTRLMELIALTLPIPALIALTQPLMEPATARIPLTRQTLPPRTQLTAPMLPRTLQTALILRTQITEMAELTLI